jgi:hypothetical protein
LPNLEIQKESELWQLTQIQEKEKIFNGSGIYLKIYHPQEIKNKQCLKHKIFYQIKQTILCEILQRKRKLLLIFMSKIHDVQVE